MMFVLALRKTDVCPFIVGVCYDFVVWLCVRVWELMLFLDFLNWSFYCWKMFIVIIM